MLEDYYKTFGLRENAGALKIAVRYIKLVNRYYALVQKDKEYEPWFYEINRAFEVIKHEGERKFYDILLKRQTNKTLDYNSPQIQEYLEIVNTRINAGNNIAEKLLNENNSESGIIQSKKSFWVKFLFFINPIFLFKFGNMPVINLISVALGLAITVYNACVFNKAFLVLGIFITVFQTMILCVNFEKYVMNKVHNKSVANK